MNCNIKQLTIGTLFSILTLSVHAESTNSQFINAYENDALWPQYVTPTQTISFENGSSLSASIPVVLSRAYEDGTLAVVDRIGTVLVDQDQTNFVTQVNGQKKTPAGEKQYNNFIRQIGRRVFDMSLSETKALSEEMLSQYDSFMICKSNMTSAAWDELNTRLIEQVDWLEANNCRPIIIFEESMPNIEFYNFLKSHQIMFPVAVPIFSKGLLDFTFTQRESSARYLWINKNGKLLAADVSLASMLP